MNNEFHNSINAKGTSLMNLNVNARSQREIILLIFQKMNRALTPSEVLSCFPSPGTPITSIRRAISNLTRDGYLKRLEIKRNGMYQTPEHYWKLIKSSK